MTAKKFIKEWLSECSKRHKENGIKYINLEDIEDLEKKLDIIIQQNETLKKNPSRERHRQVIAKMHRHWKTIQDLQSKLRVFSEMRPEVLNFAMAMEHKLRKNDRKGKQGWKTYNSEELLERLRQETTELETALRFSLTTPSDILSEAADVANFAMMIADVSGSFKMEGEADG